MKTLVRVSVVLLMMLAFVSIQGFAQSPAVGDYGSAASTNWGTTSTWVVCVTAGTWDGATVATSAPNNTKNVWIRGGTTVTVEASGKTCLNLYIDSAAVLKSDATQPTSNIRYVRISGTNFVNNGTIGNPGDDLNSLAFEFNNDVVLRGTGVTKICRLRPLSNATAKSFTFDMDAAITYLGSTGTGGAGILSENGTSNNITITVNAGRTVTCVNYCNVGLNSSQSIDSPTSTTLNVNGTLALPGPNSNLYLRVQSGKTAALNVNGTLVVGNNFYPTGIAGVTSTVTIGAAGSMTVGGTGKGNADFSQPAQIVTGAGAFALENGATITIGAAAGLDPVAGPVQTATRTFGSTANYSYLSGPAQSTGADLPSSIGVLTVNDTNGLTLTNSTTVAAIVMKRGSIDPNGKTLSYTAGGKLTYSDGIAQTTSDVEFPASGVDTLIVNNSAGLTLHASRTLTGALTLTNGIISAGANTLTMGPASVLTGGSATAFVDGAVSNQIASPGSRLWPVGQGTDYLPVTIVGKTVVGSDQITITAFDRWQNVIASLTDTSITVLRRYWTATGGGGFTDFKPDSFSFSYAPSDIAGLTFPESRLQVYQWTGTTWVLCPAIARDTAANRLIVTGVEGPGTFIIGGPTAAPVLSSSTLNFPGVTMPGAAIDSFTVRNPGGYPLLVTSAASGAFSISPASVTILPSDSIWFSVGFAPQIPDTVASAVILTHTGSNGADTITVSGIGLGAAFSASPLSIAFGDVMVGVTRHDSIIVTNPGTLPLTISSILGDNADAAVTAGPIVIQPLENAIVHVSYTPSAIGGDNVHIVFVHNGLSSADTVLVTGSGVSSVFTLNTRSLQFGNVVVGGAKADSVRVENLGTITLVVDSVRSMNPAFTAAPSTFSLNQSEQQSVVVEFTPPSAGPHVGAILFFHDGTTDTVNAAGVGVTAGFGVAPATVAFGSVIMPATKQDSVVVTNTGGAPLTITAVTSSDAHVAAVPTSATIAPSESQTFLLTFTPDSAKAYAAEIVFVHNAPSGADTVRTTGVGVGVIAVSAARQLPVGSFVLIEGIITRAMGSYIRLQDTTGGMTLYRTSAGTNHRLFDSMATGGVKAGDVIRLYGLTYQYRGLMEINDTTIAMWEKVASGSPLPSPIQVTLAEIKANGEQYESRLIEVTGLTISTTDVNFLAAKSYNIADASDGTFAVVLRTGNANDTDVDGDPVPAVAFKATGVLGQFTTAVPATSGYQLMPILKSDITPLTAVEDVPAGVPVVYSLGQNFPNPFNPSTTIQYGLPSRSTVSIRVYSLLGQEVQVLTDGIQSAGYHRITWEGRDASGRAMASGVYLVRIQAQSQERGGESFVHVRKMMLLK